MNLLLSLIIHIIIHDNYILCEAKDLYPTYGDIPLLNRKITGGMSANIAEHPYLVSVYWQMSYIVPASILCETLVVTTAWYLVDIPVHQLDVVGGQTYLNRYNDVKTVMLVVFHKNFNKYTMQHDLALLRVHEPFVYNYVLKPISIFSFRNLTPRHAMISGWGRCDTTNSTFCLQRTSSIHYGELEDTTLKTVHFQIERSKDCLEYSRNLGVSYFEGMMCLGRSTNVTFHYLGERCFGVPGAPLVVDGQLLGLVSWGLGCGYKNSLPLIYTDIRKYKFWIYDEFRTLNTQLPKSFVKQMATANNALRQYEAMSLTRPIVLEEQPTTKELVPLAVDSLLCLLHAKIYDVRDYFRNSTYRKAKREMYKALVRDITLNM